MTVSLTNNRFKIILIFIYLIKYMIYIINKEKFNVPRNDNTSYTMVDKVRYIYIYKIFICRWIKSYF